MPFLSALSLTHYPKQTVLFPLSWILQTNPCLRASAMAISSVWKALPQISAQLIPLQVFAQMPDSLNSSDLEKNACSKLPLHSSVPYISPCFLFAIAFIIQYVLGLLCITCLLLWESKLLKLMDFSLFCSLLYSKSL